MRNRKPLVALARLFSSPTAATRPARRIRLAAAERLEERVNLSATVIDLAAPRAESGGYPVLGAFPIPAGATLVDVNDSGRYALFASTDTNVIAGQQTIPSLNPNLFWLDTSTGETRLVTHRAGSTVQSAGYAGVQGSIYLGAGYGMWPMFQPLTADLSGDGQTVVFDSIITANEYDATVPAANDQATFRPPQGTTVGQLIQSFQLGTADVFVWRASAGDPANNISLVSRLNETGQQEAAALASSAAPLPIVGQPMATGVFTTSYIPQLSPSFTNFVPKEPGESLTFNKGISDNGARVLYDSWVPAGWIDTLNAGILDQQDFWTLDSFVASTNGFGGSGTTGQWSTRTASITSTGTEALGYFTLPANIQAVLPGILPPGVAQSFGMLFEPLYSQISGDGNRVVYSTRRTSADIVAGTTDSDFSSDVFANDVDSGKNLLVSRNWQDATQAAGAGQPIFFTPQNFNPQNPNPIATSPSIVFWDSQNHSVSDDGLTVAFTSSAGNLVQGWKNVTADILPTLIVGQSTDSQKWVTYQANPIDIYGFRFTSADPNVSDGSAALVNSPDGLANTNRMAGFGGMSSDGSTFLFGTIANNFYLPGFTSPYPYTSNVPKAPLPLNFILGGFSNLWARKIDWATASGTTTLVSVGYAVDASGRYDATGKPNASGNQATLESPTLPGSRDVLNTISDSGRFVMFSSSSNNLAPGIYNKLFLAGVYVRDMQTGRTTLLTTKATGNVPSAGLFLNSALATAEDGTGTFAAYVDGTDAKDMQTRFLSEELSPAPISHVYRIGYPPVSQAASATNPAVFTVAGVGVNTRPVLEFRNVSAPITPNVKASPGRLLAGFTGEWRTATGDVNADGVVDYVYGTGPNGGDTVIVVDGSSNAVLWQVASMFPTVRGASGKAARPGVFVATTDVNCDGFVDVIVGSAGPRQSRVIVYEGRRGSQLGNTILPFGQGAKVAVRVAGADVDGDGYGDVVAATGVGTPPRVAVYGGRAITLSTAGGSAIAPISAFSVGRGNGVFVAAADMNRDGRAEVIIGSTAATVAVYDGLDGKVVSSLNLGRSFSSEGVRVAARSGQVMVASGPGISPTIRLLAFANGVWTERSNLTGKAISGFTTANRYGVYVG